MIVRTAGELLLMLALAGCIYLLIAMMLVERFARAAERRRHKRPRQPPPAVTILKPLCGAEPGLAELLETFCRQDYQAPFEIVCGVQELNDPAANVVNRLNGAHPEIPVRLVVDGRPHGPNRKVSNLVNMERRSRHNIIAMSDDDIAVPPDYLSRIVAELQEPGVGAVTCLYRGIANGGVWSKLGAMAVDLHFLPNVIVGVALGLARPCFGSTIALTDRTLSAIGGLGSIADRVADDYAIGEAIRSLGLRVTISSLLVDHSCNESTLRDLWFHELRWARTIRSIDPAGHAGAILTHPVPLALIAVICGQQLGWIVAVGALGCRYALSRSLHRNFGTDQHSLALMPVRELLAFLVMVWSHCGHTVQWREQIYDISSDGRLLDHEAMGDD